MSVVRIESLPDSGNSYRFDGAAHDAPVSFFLLHTKPGEGPGLHRHPYAETFIVQEGQATFTVGDDRIKARGGDVVVAPANVPHAFVNSGQDRAPLGEHPPRPGDGDRVALISERFSLITY